MLQCDQLVQRFGSTLALDSVTVGFPTGTTALLGPNGAGKSTLLSILATLRKPTHGQVLLNGRDYGSTELSDVRALIGFLPQRFELMRFASAHHNVAYAAWARGVPKSQCPAAADRALAIVGLGHKADHRVSTLSGGQQQRVGLACSIAHEPKIVLLDEPTVGLDPEQRVELRSYLKSIADTAIVVVSTHLLDDAARTASNLVVLNEGRVSFVGSVDQLRGHGVEEAGSSALESAYVSVLRRAVVSA